MQECRNASRLTVLSAFVLLLAGACRSGEVVGGFKPDGGGGAAGQGGSAGQDGSGGAGKGGAGGGGEGAGGCRADSLDLAGCGCDSVGSKRACWPGPAGSDGVGPCRRGEQECLRGAGTATAGAWGPCVGASLPEEETCGDGVDNDCNGVQDCDDPACDAYCGKRDGGGSDGPPATPPPSCGCPPGLGRWCHQDRDGCLWGKQTCDGAGKWGTCTTTGRPAFCSTAPDKRYDSCCCVESGQCCHDDLNGAEKDPTKGRSVGKCPGTGTCGAPPGPPPGPVTSCPGVGHCVSGKQRYCWVGKYGFVSNGGGAVWGKETCEAGGTWGPCEAMPAPPPGCLELINKTAPAGGRFSTLEENTRYTPCCMGTGICCKRTQYCSLPYYSFGSCDGIACKAIR